jgi:hypothetical protein
MNKKTHCKKVLNGSDNPMSWEREDLGRNESEKEMEDNLSLAWRPNINYTIAN